MAKIKDVARLSGVSLSTVSRILNQDPALQVTPKTREKVIKAAESLNYVSKKPKKIRHADGNVHIAIVSWYSQKQELEDPYYMQIRLGCEKTFKKESITFSNILFDINKPLSETYDGVIAIGKYSTLEIMPIAAMAKNGNILCIDDSPDDTLYSSATIDFKWSMELVLQHFLSKGHTRIGYIGGKEFYKDTHEINDYRFQNFKDILSLQGLFHEIYCFFGEYSHSSGYDLMKQAMNQLDPPPTAFFLGNDIMAFGAYKALSEMGFRIPEDVSIIGFNDVSNARYMVPSLTTIKIDAQKLGELGSELLLHKIRGKISFPFKVVIPTSLSARHSVEDKNILKSKSGE